MPNLKKISMYDMDKKLLIDENNMLYWDGKPIVTEEKLVFQKHVNWAIYLTAISTAFYSLVEVLNYLGIKWGL